MRNNTIASATLYINGTAVSVNSRTAYSTLSAPTTNWSMASAPDQFEDSHGQHHGLQLGALPSGRPSNLVANSDPSFGLAMHVLKEMPPTWKRFTSVLLLPLATRLLSFRMIVRGFPFFSVHTKNPRVNRGDHQAIEPLIEV